jgi:hypothetical protein
MAKQLNQTDALETILNSGRRYTMDQLVELVEKKTRRSANKASLTVRISHLRAKGLKIKTLRGKDVKDGVTRYTIA